MNAEHAGSTAQRAAQAVALVARSGEAAVGRYAVLRVEKEANADTVARGR